MEQPVVTKTQEGGWHFAVRPNRTGEGFTAWAKRGPIVADDPVREPWDHAVYFDFGATPADALDRVRAEVFALPTVYHQHGEA